MSNRRIKVSLVAGARPNFMKIAPIIRELQRHENEFDWALVHTGQHYDREMSDVFFEELGIPRPSHYFDAGGGSHAEQTAKIMVRYEEVCLKDRPDLVVVVGDVNSTLACSIVAKKLNVNVAHVEAGLRSGDMTMPEEINRVVTDSISDVFFVTEPSGVENLIREGHPRERIHFVGQVMVDNLFYQLEGLNTSDVGAFPTQAIKLELANYGVVTMHRPSNVDSRDSLERIVGALNRISGMLPLIFPVHPRTAANIAKFNIELAPGITRTGPLAYMEFLNLWKDARMILTDSGGLQEESTALGVPCITIRENTERPITVTEGTNTLAGTDPEAIVSAAQAILDRKAAREIRRPEYWDGKAAERIVSELARLLPG